MKIIKTTDYFNKSIEELSKIVVTCVFGLNRE